MKSLLYYLGGRKKALFTHSLVEMVLEAGKVVNNMTGLLDDARILDLHYIPSRYPNGLPSGCPHLFYTSKIAEEALESAQRIVGKVNDYYSKVDDSILSDQC